MPQFFINSENITGEKIIITGNDYYHLSKVRRIKANESLQFRDEAGRILTAKVDKVTGEYLEASIIKSVTGHSPNIKLDLYMGLLKGKKFDLIIRKSIEIGVNAIIPVVTERTISGLNEKSNLKNERWNRIAEEAAKQSKRAGIPGVKETVLFNDLMNIEINCLKIIADPGPGKTFKEFFKKQEIIDKTGLEKHISILIGPEGGFSRDEIDFAEQRGWECLNFGFTELRAETAAIVLTSVIIYEMESNSEN